MVNVCSQMVTHPSTTQFDCTINLPSTIHVRKPFNKNFNPLNPKLCQTARTGGGYVPPLGLRLLGDLGMMMGW